MEFFSRYFKVIIFTYMLRTWVSCCVLPSAVSVVLMAARWRWPVRKCGSDIMNSPSEVIACTNQSPAL